MSVRTAIVTATLALITLTGCDAGSRGRDPTTPSGFAVPRYVTLRYDTVNARSGPSEEHRTLWVYHARGLPVQIVAETEQWRRICDPEGSLSWVHMRLIDGRRAVMRTGEGAISVRKSPAATSSAVATLNPRTPAPLESCEGGWCRVKLGKVKGWVQETSVWGADPEAQCRTNPRPSSAG